MTKPQANPPAAPARPDAQSGQSFWSNLSRPHYFMQMSSCLLPWISAAAAILLILGLYLAARAPEDYQQGLTVKIMYIHVPFAWLAMLCYTIMTVSATGTLLWKHLLADIALKSAAPIGAVFTVLALLTGSIWGRPTWGSWWEWGDARMFSMFILLLIYLGIIALSRAFDNARMAAAAAAILTIIGFIDIPIIKFSVEWWNSLHQPSSFIRRGGIAIAPSLLWPLLVNAIGFTLLFAALHLAAMRNEIRRRRISAYAQKLAWAEEAAQAAASEKITAQAAEAEAQP